MHTVSAQNVNGVVNTAIVAAELFVNRPAAAQIFIILWYALCIVYPSLVLMLDDQLRKFEYVFWINSTLSINGEFPVCSGPCI